MPESPSSFSPVPVDVYVPPAADNPIPVDDAAPEFTPIDSLILELEELNAGLVGAFNKSAISLDAPILLAVFGRSSADFALRKCESICS